MHSPEGRGALPSFASIIWRRKRNVLHSWRGHPSASRERQWKPQGIKCWTSCCESSWEEPHSWLPWRQRPKGLPWLPEECWWVCPKGSEQWHSPALPAVPPAAAAAAAPSWRCGSDMPPGPPVDQNREQLSPLFTSTLWSRHSPWASQMHLDFKYARERGQHCTGMRRLLCFSP